MYDKDMLIGVLRQTLDAVNRLMKRFEPVESVDFFTDTAGGQEKLDAICMLLIAVGESLGLSSNFGQSRKFIMFQKRGASSSCSLSPGDHAFIYHGISPGERVGVREKEYVPLSQLDHFWPKLEPRPKFKEYR